MGKQTSAAVSKAYEYIYRGILSGDIPMGSLVSESDVSKTLGISRSPVREALNHMESEGIVNRFVGRGTFVTDFSISDLKEIFELRIMFELHAVSKACIYMDDKKLDDLETKFKNLNKDSQAEEYFSANTELHYAIIEYAGNSRLRDFYSTLLAQFAIINRITARDPEHFDRSRATHLAIINAIRKRDDGQARTLLHDHLTEVERTTLIEFEKPKLARIHTQQTYEKTIICE